MVRRFSLALILSAAVASAVADPGYYLITPYDNEGLVTVDFRYWTVKPRGSTEIVWPEVGLGYGVTSRWTTEVFTSYVGPANGALTHSTLNWQNEILLTQGEQPFDLGVHLQWIKDRARSAQYGIEYGLVFQTDVDRTQINANLVLEREFNAAKSQPAQLKYQWQLRHRWMNGLHVGLVGFGEVGDWNNWAASQRQSHRLGPAVFATAQISDRQAVKLQAAYLEGKTYGQRGHMFTMRLHWEY